MNARRLSGALLLAQAVLGLIALSLIVFAWQTADTAPLGIAGALVAGGMAAAWALSLALARRDAALDQLKRTLAFGPTGGGTEAASKARDGEIATLITLAAKAHDDRRRQADGGNDARFAAALGALTSGVVLLSPTGQISLINGKAKALLGAGQAAIGASIFSILGRDDLLSARAHSEAAGRAFHAQVSRVAGGAVDLEIAALDGTHGTLLTFEGDIAEWLPGCEHAFDLHDNTPDQPPEDATPLATLPASVLDTETTGLDVNRDRIVQFAAVRMKGERIFAADSVERIVNPGRPIPPASSAIHGITDDIAASGRPIDEEWGALEPFLKDRVVVGHNIGFDMAMLERAAALAGRPWTRPRTLCTARLAEALSPQETDFNLEAVAERLGVEITGRHTAMGDTLVTAEVFRRQMILLNALRVITLSDAEAFANKARRIIAAQTDSGW
jgi:DNA polymerase-3 subunit epsilon